MAPKTQISSLSKNPYRNQTPLFLAVDCIVFGFDQEGLKLLIFRREYDPFRGRWSLIGSFVDRDQDLQTTAHRVLQQTTGLKNLYMEQLHTFGQTGRDPGGRVVSVAYWSLIRLNPDIQNVQVPGHQAKWIDFKEVPDLVLDHNQMVDAAIIALRERASVRPVGFELLPDKFTLPQLLSLYEAIFQTSIDDRNFRRKILKTGLLIPVGEKDKSSSRRGAHLYRFDYEKYQQLSKKGYLFEIT